MLNSIWKQVEKNFEFLRESECVRGTVLSPWIIVDKYYATRIVKGGDVDCIADRVAFIEKSPRIRVKAAPNRNDICEPLDHWWYGAKREDGFDKESRMWADEKLIELGYVLTEDVYRVYRYEIFDANGRPILLLVDESEADQYKAKGYTVKTLYEKV